MNGTDTSTLSIERAMARARRERSRAARAFVAGAANRIGHAFRPLATGGRAAARRWSRWRAERRAVAELRGLSDRTLADIGLHRSHIRGVVRELGDEAAPRTAAARGTRAAPEAANLVPFPASSKRRTRRTRPWRDAAAPTRAAS